jgi:hypothetical protein
VTARRPEFDKPELCTGFAARSIRSSDHVTARATARPALCDDGFTDLQTARGWGGTLRGIHAHFGTYRLIPRSNRSPAGRRLFTARQDANQTGEGKRLQCPIHVLQRAG